MSTNGPDPEKAHGQLADELPAPEGYVLVTSTGKHTAKYHRDDPDTDHLQAECGAILQGSDSEWITKTHPRHVVFYEQCDACTWHGLDTQTCADCGRTFPSPRSFRGHRRRGGGTCPQEEASE